MRKLLTIGMVLALVFAVALVLSHVSRGMTAPKDVETSRAANMTSGKSNDSNTVEVDGIRFETLVPERVLSIPNGNGAKTLVQFGIRVTNLSPTPYRFIFFSLFPELLGSDRQAIHLNYASNATKAPKESDFLLAMPGESLTYFMNAEFYWYNYKLRLVGEARDGGFWHFDALKPGIYWVRFTYRNKSAVRQIPYGGIIEGLWTGMVSTPFVDFRLVQP